MTKPSGQGEFGVSSNPGFVVERFEGMKVWSRHGDGRDPLDCRRNAGADALVKRFPLFSPEFLDDAVTFTLSLLPGHQTPISKVVAMAGLLKEQRSPNLMHLCFVNVDADHWGEGHGTLLCKSLLAQLTQYGIQRLACTGYSESGLQRLRPVLLRETEALGMTFKDKARIEYRLSEQPPSIEKGRKFSPR